MVLIIYGDESDARRNAFVEGSIDILISLN